MYGMCYGYCGINSGIRNYYNKFIVFLLGKVIFFVIFGKSGSNFC